MKTLLSRNFCRKSMRVNFRNFNTVAVHKRNIGRWLAPLLSNQAVTSSKASVTYLSQNETKTYSTTTPWNFLMMIMPTMMTITYERRTSSSSLFSSRFTFLRCRLVWHHFHSSRHLSRGRISVQDPNSGQLSGRRLSKIGFRASGFPSHCRSRNSWTRCQKRIS